VILRTRGVIPSLRRAAPSSNEVEGPYQRAFTPVGGPTTHLRGEASVSRKDWSKPSISSRDLQAVKNVVAPL